MTQSAGERGEDQREFFAMTQAERDLKLWLMTKATVRQVAELSQIVKGQSLNAWWVRFRDFLVLATPIAGLMWLVMKGG